VIIRTVPTSTSTNEDMLALARSGSPEGLWLRAESQSGGRGRLGRAWQSPPGNLYVSTIVRLRPGDPPPATLALVAAVALDDVLMGFVAAAQLMIKWPNDVLVDGAKIAGILLERADDAIVIGIGVNLASHPEDIGRPVTSLAASGGAVPDPAYFLEELADSFDRWLARWRGEGLGVVRTRWLERAHPVGAALSAALPDGSTVDGLFDGLDRDGALRLRLADGDVRVIHAGDVFLFA
jgi:BirA family transcriptional regulator, biotin operon repressor / biotin---[acetyl-CoA-carboxylase] ligase